MAITFENVMETHPDNYAVYEEIRDNFKSIIPFVGAGMTASIFGGWGSAVEKLGEYITDDRKKQKLSTLVKDGRYLSAAQFLEKERGKNNLKRNLVGHFSIDKVEAKEAVLQREAIGLFPYLFDDRPIVTTNFDEAIETLFSREGKRITALNPFSDELLNQAISLANTPCLFKIHGSVVGKMVDYDKIVFTKKQYRKTYSRWGGAKKTLKRFFENRSLLFLGCSLLKDRTVTEMTKCAKGGLCHYAIVHCEGMSADERIQQLARFNVRAILYLGGKHESVRVVLEKLLADIYPDKYEFLKSRLDTLGSSVWFDSFVYLSRMTTFVGRDGELDSLKKFVLDRTKPFCWWAITGKGGTGKSRLALELGNVMVNQYGWDCRYLKQTDYSNIAKLCTSFSRDTLLISDYAQAHAREIGMLIQECSSWNYPVTIRLLLLEREGRLAVDKGNDGWVKLLYDEVHNLDRVDRSCWNENFLQLEGMEDDTLLQIMSSYAQNMLALNDEKKAITLEGCKQLLEKLKEIDPECRRPLYALFLVESTMDEQNPLNWDKKRILDYLIDREVVRIREGIREVLQEGKDDQELIQECILLLVASTVLGGLSVEKVDTCCNKELTPSLFLRKEVRGLKSVMRLFSQLGLTRKHGIVSIEPDILGEYFVYRWLAESENYANMSWTSEISEESVERISLYVRMMLWDYSYLSIQNPTSWLDLLRHLAGLFHGTTKENENLTSILFTALSRTENGAIIGDVFAMYEELCKSNSDDYALAQGLLEILRGSEGSKAYASRLSTLCKQRDELLFKVILVKSLYYQALINCLGTEELLQTISEIEFSIPENITVRTLKYIDDNSASRVEVTYSGVVIDDGCAITREVSDNIETYFSLINESVVELDPRKLFGVVLGTIAFCTESRGAAERAVDWIRSFSLSRNDICYKIGLVYSMYMFTVKYGTVQDPKCYEYLEEMNGIAMSIGKKSCYSIDFILGSMMSIGAALEMFDERSGFQSQQWTNRYFELLDDYPSDYGIEIHYAAFLAELVRYVPEEVLRLNSEKWIQRSKEVFYDYPSDLSVRKNVTSAIRTTINRGGMKNQIDRIEKEILFLEEVFQMDFEEENMGKGIASCLVYVIEEEQMWGKPHDARKWIEKYKSLYYMCPDDTMIAEGYVALIGLGFQRDVWRDDLEDAKWYDELEKIVDRHFDKRDIAEPALLLLQKRPKHMSIEGLVVKSMIEDNRSKS